MPMMHGSLYQSGFGMALKYAGDPGLVHLQPCQCMLEIWCCQERGSPKTSPQNPSPRYWCSLELRERPPAARHGLNVSAYSARN